MDKSMEQPSPLPWEHVAATDHHGAYVVSASGLDVCDLYEMSNPRSYAVCNGGDSKPVPFIDMDANARLIVRAVNSHDALVKACEAALEHLYEIADKDEDPDEWDLTKQLVAALAAAAGCRTQQMCF